MSRLLPRSSLRSYHHAPLGRTYTRAAITPLYALKSLAPPLSFRAIAYCRDNRPTTPSTSRQVGYGGTALRSRSVRQVSAFGKAEGEGLGVQEDVERQPDYSPLASLSPADLFTLPSRTVIITGGGRGLGLTVAHSLLQQGASVACLDLLPDPSEPQWSAAKSLAKKQGLKLSYHKVDVTSQPKVETAIRRIFAKAPSDKPVRGLFCAAGINLLRDATDYKPEQFRKVLEINLTGSFFAAQSFAREWISRHPANPAPAKGAVAVEGTESETRTTDAAGERKAGTDEPVNSGGASIVFTASMSAHIANLGIECVAYNASKAGVLQMGRSLAAEWGKYGVRVNTLSPGYIRTAMTAALLDENPKLYATWLQGSLLGRLSTPDEFRGPVVFMLSDASSFMTGSDMIVDGGHTAT